MARGPGFEWLGKAACSAAIPGEGARAVVQTLHWSCVLALSLQFVPFWFEAEGSGELELKGNQGFERHVHGEPSFHTEGKLQDGVCFL